MPDPFQALPNYVNPDYSTPSQRAMQLAYAKHLLDQSNKPVEYGAWGQGAANMVNALLGGYESGRAQSGETRGRNIDIANILGAFPQQTPGEPPQAAPASPLGGGGNTRGKIYSENEPSPLDPLSGQERDMAVRTIAAGEGGNPASQLGVANVIRNRAVDGGYGGDTASGVLLAKNQFEPWNNPEGRARMGRLDPNSPQYQQASALLDQAYRGNDPTNGAKNFYAPVAQAALGRPVPAWGRGQGQDLGEHRFFGGANVPTPAAQPMAFAGGNQDPATAAIAGAPQAQPVQAQGGQQPAQQQPLGMDPRLIGALLNAQNLPPSTLNNLWGLATEKPQWGGIGEYDAMGHEKKGWISPRTQTITRPQGAGSGSASNDVAPSYDENGRDEAFLKSLDPTTQAAVKAITEGKLSPTGRNLQQLLPIAARYENGFDQTVYKARNTFQTQLGSGNPSSIGGQKTLMGTSLGHLGELAETASDLGNSSGMGLAPVGHTINAVRGLTTEQAAKKNKLAETVDRFAGEVGKLYSGSQGGGVQERDQTRARFGGNQTPEELAAGLEASRDLIKSKLMALENQRDQVMGPSRRNVDFLGDNGRAALTRIDSAIEKLRSKGGEKTSAAPSGSPSVQKWERKPDGSLGPVQ